MNENRREILDTIVARSMAALIVFVVAGVLYFPSDSWESFYVVASGAAGFLIVAIVHFGGRYFTRVRAVDVTEGRKA